MALKSRFLLSLAAFSSLAVADTAGYFDNTSFCVDSKGFEKCYEKVKTSYENCISSNCSGGSKSCYDSCDGDTSCMGTHCPNLGIDCINACGCVRATDQIDCAASSCWNQVYSCEYQQTAEDVIKLCINFDADQIPYWPPPDDAIGGCSCNIAKADRKELLISAQLTECTNNMTNLDQLSTTDEITVYEQACMCCAQSAIVSAIWGTCPNTKPSLIGADDWYSMFLGPNHWDECEEYLAAYDCDRDLGYAAESAGDTHTFYKPNNIPKNGTESLFNTGSALTSPVSGATFTWTEGTLLHGITAAPTSHMASATGTHDQGTTATETGASATKIGGATSYHCSAWAGVGFIGALALVIA
ncbi:uncharacterized protein N7482_005056 [Penicillium canariense]|uniref:Uncharacterized protein n=1 Tax=Penicillium canariense TaxID=189055 RepID=A0A9W9I1P1_9EURO|nr:uncharacterized protein N7482_005056 [Penicillium canariense]KAJ5166275.1 hypothetical protein N7482_005056 [Penicillium canariense]